MSLEEHPIVIDVEEGSNAIVIEPIAEYAAEENAATTMTESVEQRLLSTIDGLR